MVRERQLRSHPLWGAHQQDIERLLIWLRRCVEPREYLEWQMELLKVYGRAQSRATSAAARKREWRYEIRPAAISDRTRLQQINEQIGVAALEGAIAKASMALLRSLGDTLLWQVLRYRRGVITALGHGRRVTRLAVGSGLDAELEHLYRLWDAEGAFCIHADLTNCITFGDLLRILDWETRDFDLIEVKASARKDRTRQIERIRYVGAVVRGDIATISDDVPATPVKCPVRLRAHHDQLCELLRRAETHTYAWAEVEPGFVVTAIDESDPAVIADRIPALRRETLQGVGWGTEAGTSADEWSASSVNRVLRDRRYSFPGQAPLALLPLRPGTVTKLLTGPLLYYSTIHVPTLVERFRHAGINVEVAPHGADGKDFVTLCRGRHRISIPAPMLDQLLLELWSVESFIEVGEWLLAAAPGATRRTFGLDFPSERELWDKSAPKS